MNMPHVCTRSLPHSQTDDAVKLQAAKSVRVYGVVVCVEGGGGICAKGVGSGVQAKGVIPRWNATRGEHKNFLLVPPPPAFYPRDIAIIPRRHPSELCDGHSLKPRQRSRGHSFPYHLTFTCATAQTCHYVRLPYHLRFTCAAAHMCCYGGGQHTKSGRAKAKPEACLSAPACLPVWMVLYLSVCRSVSLFVYLPACFVCLFACLPAHVPACLSVCPSVCLPAYKHHISAALLLEVVRFLEAIGDTDLYAHQPRSQPCTQLCVDDRYGPRVR